MSDSDPIEIIQRFCDAWPGGDLDAILAFFTEDATYHNIPMAPVNGLEEIRSTIAGFTAGNTVEFRVVHIAAAGDVVLTERIDAFTLPDGRTIELPVSGTFELRDGKISAWRDYFDLQMFLTQLSPPTQQS